MGQAKVKEDITKIELINRLIQMEEKLLIKIEKVSNLIT